MNDPRIIIYLFGLWAVVALPVQIRRAWRELREDMRSRRDR